MTDLSIEEFAAFFREVHDGQDPFPWQVRLARQVWANGRWPETIDLPTAAGKTAVLEIAVFLLALESTAPPGRRKFPVRLVFVVDRRVIVDQAAERATKIAVQLHGATDGVLAAVAARLRLRTGEAVPLAVATLRGGIQLDRTWARRPDQPTIIASTVDQVGSRLLGRGYGVSDRMRPIHAGLLGSDTLFFLDEAHLSRPFAETLAEVRRYQRHPWPRADLPDRFTVVQMSATPGVAADFKLDAREHAPRLAQRFGVPKLARLVSVPVGAKDEEPARLKAMVQAARVEVERLLEDGVPRIIGVVVNRVATARAIFAALNRREDMVPCVLLTGRSRPLERDALIGKYLEELSAGRPHPTAHSLVVVATQCIEAGADFDFDALVTECASLDALRQRFGRLDRLGDNQRASAVILARKDQIKAKSEDNVYGASLANTWAWLNQIATGKPPMVDFGVDALALKLPTGKALEELLAPQRHAPVLLPAHLDAWAQTNPRPSADPEVALWLHGPQAGPPDVQIVWRVDLTEEQLKSGQVPEERLLARPPGSGEMLAMPIWAVRRWLSGRSEGEVSDIEGSADPHARDNPNHQVAARTCLRWMNDAVVIAGPGEIEPGDVILVPSSYGGADECGWAPFAQDKVADLGDLVEWRQRGRAIWTVHAETPGSEGAELLKALQGGEDEVREDHELVRDYLAQLEGPTMWHRQIVTKLLHDVDTLRVVRFFDGDKLTMVQLVGGTKDAAIEARSDDFTTADDNSSLFTRDVSLAGHSRGVEHWARTFGERCGLPLPLVEALALAGWLHDVGKADPRFQCWLHDGDEVSTLRASHLLAKSGLNPRDRSARRRARARAGYPSGGRHELQSLALIKDHAGLRARVQDFDLVLHLVASHHGFCRPLPPAIPDVSPVTIVVQHGEDQLMASSEPVWSRLDSGIADRFWTLIERYGWFGLTWLEALLRLADHHRSDLESQHGEGRLEKMT